MLNRQNYAMIMAKYKNLKEKPRLTPSTLFLVQDIKSNKSAYSFDPLENAQQQADELRLNINDEFIATHFGLYLYGTASAPVEGGDPTTTPQLLASLPFQEMAANESMKAGNLWAGALSVSVNNVKFIEKLDVRRMNKSNKGQFSLEGNNNFDYNEDGMINVQPLTTLSGARKNDVSLTLPDSLETITFDVEGAETTITYNIDKIVLRMFGLNAQNAAKFQS